MSATALGVVLVVLSAVTEGFAQTVLKKSVLAGVHRRGWIALGVVLFVVEALLYTGALRHLDVSAAFPLTGLSFVSVAILSGWLLHKMLTTMRWIGVGLILLGAALLVVDA
jgi:drug/metabolite transporter (DMT)-like permease